MDFFKKLFALSETVDLTLRIMKKNGKLTISVLPAIKEAEIKPILITGTPDELDSHFFATINGPLQAAGIVIQNIEEFEKGIKEAEAEKKKESEKKKTEPAKPSPSTSNKKAASKKPAPKKAPAEKKAAPAPKPEKKEEQTANPEPPKPKTMEMF